MVQIRFMIYDKFLGDGIAAYVTILVNLDFEISRKETSEYATRTITALPL